MENILSLQLLVEDEEDEECFELAMRSRIVIFQKLDFTTAIFEANRLKYFGHDIDDNIHRKIRVKRKHDRMGGIFSLG